MIFRALALLFLLSSFFPRVYAGQNTGESDQQINNFSLAGYGEKGKKSWDLAGESADIFNELIKLNNITGNLYGKDEDVKLTADSGDFNKDKGLVHLERNVVITTSTGARLTTDALDWDRKNQTVATDEQVNIQKDNMTVVASGARGEPNLNKVALEKDVRLDINSVDKDKIIITCDGPLQIDYGKNIATFLNNVKVEKVDTVIYSDKMDVYFIASGKQVEEKSGTVDNMGSKIDKIIARGNVRVLRGENTSYSEEAIYTAFDKKLTLTGRPKLIIVSTEGLKDASTGN